MLTSSALLSLALGTALAQSGPPDRRIPPTVLSEVALLENRFEVALAQDCAAERCYPKGCVYVDHAVSDRGPSASLPGLGLEPVPEPESAQAHLTRARCAFAHEEDIDTEDVAALARRLGTKLSAGWVAVSVSHQPLKTLPEYLREAPEPEVEVDEPEPEPEPKPEPPRSKTRELWEALLPHFWWMLGIGLLTLAGTLLIWALRRVGQPSIEDRMLLAELERGEPAPPPVATVEVDDGVELQDAAWAERLAAMDPSDPDPTIQALVRDLLRSGDLALLAKAVLRYPDTLPRAFPEGGDVASAKLAFAAFLESVDPATLPDDETFFDAWSRRALAASVASQGDARLVRALREEFGAAGLAGVIGQVSARPGALLFALAPPDTQDELQRLLGPAKRSELAEMLLRSNRMDPAETAHLFELVTALRTGAPLPASGTEGVTDRGPTFDAAAAASVLLEGMAGAGRSALFRGARQRSQGALPAWMRGILVSDMLLALPAEARTDLMLGVDVGELAGWLSGLDESARQHLLQELPDTLRTSLRAASLFASREQQLALSARGRAALAAGFQEQLSRLGRSFADVAGGPSE